MTVIDGTVGRCEILRSASGLPRNLPGEIPETGGEKALRHNVLAGNSPFPRGKTAGVALNERYWCAVYYWSFGEEGKRQIINNLYE